MNNWFHSACNEKSSTRLPEVGVNKAKVASSLKMSETGRVVKLYTILAQAALRAPSEVVLQCVAGHCYYQLLFVLSFCHTLVKVETRVGIIITKKITKKHKTTKPQTMTLLRFFWHFSLNLAQS